MTIKHLVFSGGGPAGLVLYGAAKQLNNVYWNLNNIESIYGTSIGAFIGIIISLGYDWDVVDDYLIKHRTFYSNKCLPYKGVDQSNFYNRRNITFTRGKRIECRYNIQRLI